MSQLGPEHLAELLRRHAPALVLYARTWCDSPDDVVQEALLSLVAQRQPPRDTAARAATEVLESLASENREVIVARLWGGLTFEEIATLAGCSSSAAHRRYTSGMSELKERLGLACPTDESTPKI